MVGPCSIIAASVCMCLCDEVRLYDLMHLLCMCKYSGRDDNFSSSHWAISGLHSNLHH
jgi:hypothetical protein